MLRVALKMLMGDRAKYAGLLSGIAFTSFLVTFAASYFCGFMTRGFALIAENPAADVWVMDPAVVSAEKTANMPASALDRIRGVEGVASAVPLALGTAEGALSGRTVSAIPGDRSGRRHALQRASAEGRRVTRCAPHS
jgi:putative ABC transport system permease protein